MNAHYQGLLAATFTPMRPDGSVSLVSVGPLVDHLASSGVTGIYVCGSTGEGMSLSSQERADVAEAFTRAAKARLRVMVQVGHCSLAEARSLAAHAVRIGADAISATPPFYFPLTSVEVLADSLAEIAAGAPDLPFYYYHIPGLTGVQVDMVALMQEASKRIPSFAGLKYTAHTMQEYQACVDFADGRYDILWGTDEMLLGAFTVGARGAVGSTYNFAAPIYLQIIAHFQAGNLAAARRLQAQVVQLVRVLLKYRGLPAFKAVMKFLGLDCGPTRLPLKWLDDNELKQLHRELEQLEFFQWLRTMPLAS